MKPVSGDFDPTVYLFPVGTRVPAKGPVANISGLSGPRGSNPGGVVSRRIFVIKPDPPMKVLQKVCVNFFLVISKKESQNY